jgi:hypothetical protein
MNVTSRISARCLQGSCRVQAVSLVRTDHDLDFIDTYMYCASQSHKKIMSPMMDDIPIETEQEGFTLLSHGHRDMVGATAFNSYGDRFASSSVDGKIKIYNRHQDGSWNICDTWGAHTAEILQVCPDSTSQI